jgi:hypothetical protein
VSAYGCFWGGSAVGQTRRLCSRERGTAIAVSRTVRPTARRTAEGRLLAVTTGCFQAAHLQGLVCGGELGRASVTSRPLPVPGRAASNVRSALGSSRVPASSGFSVAAHQGPATVKFCDTPLPRSLIETLRRHAARSRRSLGARNSCCGGPANGRFPARKLNATLARHGQKRQSGVAGQPAASDCLLPSSSCV